MDKNMRSEIEKNLSKMTVVELREAAKKGSIDLSGAIRKNEIIDRILKSDEALEISGVSAGAEIVDETVIESEKFEKKEPVKTTKIERKVKSEDKLTEIREYVRFTLGKRPSFFEIDGLMEASIAKFSSGDFAGAIKALQSARARASDIYSQFRIFTTAVGIDASERLLTKPIEKGTISKDEASKLVLNACQSFVNGTPQKREETLEQLESGALEALDKIVGNLAREIELMKKRANELKEIGGDVVQPLHVLEEADKLKALLKIEEANRAAEHARNLVQRAEKVRLEEIKYSIPRVRASVEVAKSIGADVTEPEKDLKKAVYYLDRGEIKLCVESMRKSEGALTQVHQSKISSDAGLRRNQLEKAKAAVRETGPFFNEAATYGMDVSEGMYYLRNTQTAVARNDALNAPIFAKRLEEIKELLSKEIEKLKKRSIHATGLKCQKCGQEMLYDYDTGIRRCSNCTHWIRREKETHGEGDQKPKNQK